ncbi:hypothetical protein BAY59_12140 [Prauserella coralliicola]|nr:hypothetical protein BAY59_12140 [Prauserella coralliicola]
MTTTLDDTGAGTPRRDAADPFPAPTAQGGEYPEAAFLAGNPLGLRPSATRAEPLEDLDSHAVRSQARFHGLDPDATVARLGHCGEVLDPLAREGHPVATAEAWRVSGPPILAMGPVRTSLSTFEQIGMPALRARGLRPTGYLAGLLDAVTATRPLAPREPLRLGARPSPRAERVGADEPSRRTRLECGVVTGALARLVAEEP